MKKMKRLMAVLLTLAMVLGMSVVTFAAPGDPVITVKGVDAGSTVTYNQIIEPNPNEVTGWSFTNVTAADQFKTTLKQGVNANKNDQEIIAGLIIYAGGTLPQELQSTAADITNIDDAWKAAADAVDPTNKVTRNAAGNYDITPTTAGVYVIHATDVVKKDPVTSKVVGYIKYNPMASYVSFNYTNGNPPSLNDDTVEVTTAKVKETTDTLEKESTEDVVAVGDTVHYTIQVSIPYINESAGDEDIFRVVDKIEGAKYVTSPGVYAENVNDKVNVTVQFEDDTENVKTKEGTISSAEAADSKYLFLLDLSEYAANRDNAGKMLTITYEAYVEKTIVENNAESNVKHDPNSDWEKGQDDDDKVLTASIKLTKLDGDVSNAKVTLSGAKFVLYYTDKDENGNDIKHYAVTRPAVGAEINDADYIVTGWNMTNPKDVKQEELEAGQSKDDILLITKVDATDNGTFKIKGLDNKVEYYFEEVEAPEGYSLNNNSKKVEWKQDNDGKVEMLAESEVEDTRLKALPDTGGIGTTIFTIVGCLIMIAAAGLFFASRRKTEK